MASFSWWRTLFTRRCLTYSQFLLAQSYCKDVEIVYIKFVLQGKLICYRLRTIYIIMRLLKSHPILGLLNSYMVDSPQPASISYMWNFGSLLGACLVIQIVTGITLAMHYTPNIDLAFISVEHIMRDVHYGWLIRYLHANVASFFFIFVYLHIGRGLYYGSYRSPRTLAWAIGVIILILMIVTAFLGTLSSPKWIDLESIVMLQMSAFPTATSARLKEILEKIGITPLAVFENLHLNGAKEAAYVRSPMTDATRALVSANSANVNPPCNSLVWWFTT